MTSRVNGLLQFDPMLVERVWGGNRIAPLFHVPDRPGSPIGEAWLISDHASAQSVVRVGPHAGKTLHDLLAHEPERILGKRTPLTRQGRFPLLLKLLDSSSPLSIQVHPDDACAQRLGEDDSGKTEMWHVLEAEPGAEVLYGLDSGMDPDSFAEAVTNGTIEQHIDHINVETGDNLFVAAGTVHAIGGGILIAEIQQNSDLTYRIFDYNRPGPDGQPRALHIDKAREAIQFGTRHAGKTIPLELPSREAERTVIAACRFFAAERIVVDGDYIRQTRNDSFHIVLNVEGSLSVSVSNDSAELAPLDTVLVPACQDSYTLRGEGAALVYYVPDLHRDIVQPLMLAGHPYEAIVRLAGSRDIDLFGHLVE